MNHWIPRRRWVALLMLSMTLASVASAAFAGGSYGHRRSRSSGYCDAPRVSASFSWRSGGEYGPAGYGGYAARDRSYGYSRPVREEACAVQHEPHVWYDGRLWCSGKNADGSWRGPWHCEDRYGRKKVNLVDFDPGCEKWVSAYPR